MLLNWVNDQSSFESGFRKVVITSKASASIIVRLGSSVWQIDICSPTLIPNNGVSHVSAGAEGNNDVTVNNTESTQVVIDRMLAALEASGFYNPALQEQNELVQFSGLTARQAARQSRNGPSSTATNANKAPHHQNMALLGEDIPDKDPSQSPEWVIELVNHIFAGLDDCTCTLLLEAAWARDLWHHIHHTASDPFFPQPSLSDGMRSRVQIGTVLKQGDSSGKSKQSDLFGKSRQSDLSGKSSSEDSAWDRATLPVTLSHYDDLAGH